MTQLRAQVAAAEKEGEEEVTEEGEEEAGDEGEEGAALDLGADVA